jgi:hypothetical protein
MADSRILAARAALASAALAFNPHQRRDSRGRWVKLGDHEKRPGRKKSATPEAPPAAKAVEIIRDLDSRGKDQASPQFYDPGELPPGVQEWAEGLFDYEDPQTGFKTKVTRVRAKAAPGPDARGRSQGQSNVDVVLDVLDSSGKKVGGAIRSIYRNSVSDKLQAVHLSFKLDKAAQGGGFSSRWLRQMEDRYREAGIEQIAVSASDTVGGYAWAKAGFDFEDAQSAEDVAARLAKTQRRLAKSGAVSPGLAAEAKELVRRAKSGDPEERPTPMEFAMLGWTPGATSWLGKETMLGANWQGVKVL